jgi:hypothetical protein
MKLIWAAVLGCVLATTAGIARAQSLADIARQQKAEKGSHPATVKVFTNDNIPRSTSLDDRAPAAASSDSAQAPEEKTDSAEPKPPSTSAASDQQGSGGEKPPEDKKKTKEYWQSKFADARAVVARADEELQLSQDELNLAQMSEARELDPNVASQLSQEVTAKQSAAEAKQAADEKAKQAMAKLQQEFDESGAPKEWLPAEPEKQ